MQDPEVLSSTRTSCPQIYCVYSVTGVMMFFVSVSGVIFL